ALAPSDGDVIPDLAGQHPRGVPIDCYVTNELERGLVLVILRESGRHDERRVEHDVMRELACQSGPDPGFFERVCVTAGALENVEDARCLVEGAVQHAGEEENRLVLRRIPALAAPGV